MSRVMPLSLFLGVGLLLALSQRGLGGEPPSKDELTKKYRELIQRLVSPNKEPMTTNRSSGSVKFPAGYDVKAQERIAAARQVLHDNFAEALPFLIEALDDTRYCMTINWADGDAYYNRSVGSICRDVIASQLEVYRGKIRFSGPQHWHRYGYGPISKEWWQARKGRSLAELQIEAIDWALERRMAEPAAEVREDREHEIADLRKLRGEIATSGKPVKRRAMYPMVTSDR
jgi:hypothetical protein